MVFLACTHWIPALREGSFVLLISNSIVAFSGTAFIVSGIFSRAMAFQLQWILNHAIANSVTDTKFYHNSI